MPHQRLAEKSYVALAEAGLLRYEIMERMGVSKQRVSALARKTGVDTVRQSDLDRAKWREELASLVDAGLTIGDIASRLGLSYSTVRGRLVSLGLRARKERERT